MSPGNVQLVTSCGYAAVAVGVAIESVGIPFPGETTLIAAALYAGATHRLDIVAVVLAAAMGAVCGGSLGIGRRLGLNLLSKFGRSVGITPKRLLLGRYLLSQHGGKLVFFGRFLPYLRAIVAFICGVGRMNWLRFFLCNSASAFIWATICGGGAYFLGSHVDLVLGPATIAGTFITVALIVAILIGLRQHEGRLTEKAQSVPRVTAHGSDCGQWCE